MRHKHLYISCLVLGYTLLSISPGHAQKPLPFHQIGMLDSISLDQQRIVIYDMVFHFPQDTPVYRYHDNIDNSNPDLRQRVSPQDLKPGMKLGYTAVYNRGDRHERVVQEVWILPRRKFSSLE
jgi:hypothetical protein